MAEDTGRMTQQGYGVGPVEELPVFRSRDQVASFGTWVSPFGDVLFKSKAWANITAGAQEATTAWFEYETKVFHEGKDPAVSELGTRKKMLEDINERNKLAQQDHTMSLLEKAKMSEEVKYAAEYNADLEWNIQKGNITELQAKSLMRELVQASQGSHTGHVKAWKEYMWGVETPPNAPSNYVLRNPEPYTSNYVERAN